MRAATYHDRKDIRVEDVEPKNVGEEQVRIDIDSCGICGSDLHEYTAGPIFVPGDEPHPVSQETAPIRMGHEFSGTISEIGESVTGLELGDAVAINPILYCGDCRQCQEGNYHICNRSASSAFQAAVADSQKALFWMQNTLFHSVTTFRSSPVR